MKILDIEGVAQDKYKGAEIFRTHEEGRCYDEIITYRSLAKLTLPQALAQFQAWAAMLNPGGLIHLFEPAAEWWCYEVLAGRVTFVTMFHLFGADTFVFRSAWTMGMLRNLLDVSGLIADNAVTRQYVLGQIDGKENVYGQEHYVVGRKPGGEKAAWMQD